MTLQKRSLARSLLAVAMVLLLLGSALPVASAQGTGGDLGVNVNTCEGLQVKGVAKALDTGGSKGPVLESPPVPLPNEPGTPNVNPGIEIRVDSSILPHIETRDIDAIRDGPTYDAGLTHDCAHASVESHYPDNHWQSDADTDGMGDDWTNQYQQWSGQTIESADDLDGDGLANVDEFRWNLVPVCFPGFGKNCQDHESSTTDGTGGDGWLDGEEVAYWNNPGNDHYGIEYPNRAFYDLDSRRDIDNDGQVDTRDVDADNDGLLDGSEFHVHGTYPEYMDSDCEAAAITCTPVIATHYGDGNRLGAPGTGDGLTDALEVAAWNSISASAWSTDHDGDGIQNNLLDPDSDNDGLLDGIEFLNGQVQPHNPDTDGDGVLDGDEADWSSDADGDGLINANDPDADGDGMGDAWEHMHDFDATDPSDAGQDRDGDGLSNLGEHDAGTDPDVMDTEGDLLLDGEEVLIHGTDPLDWDTDADGIPDYVELDAGLDPLDPSDAGLDVDNDSYDDPTDSLPAVAWTNLKEYQHDRPTNWDEATDGPYLNGTRIQDPDTDGDGLPDGYEVYYGSDPLDALSDADLDGDGLGLLDEFLLGTSPSDPDTDGDGLCDGGRGTACTLPDGTGAGMPGEADYGSDPRNQDTDGDRFPDGDEAQRWDPAGTGMDDDMDGDGLGGVVDADADGDRLKDGDELIEHGTDPGNTDTDGDRLDDGTEVLDEGTGPLVTDTDGDGLGDGVEVLDHGTLPLVVDTDGDALSDGDEVNLHQTEPLDVDTDGDGMDDGWEVRYDLRPLDGSDASEDPDNDGLRLGDLDTDAANGTRRFLDGLRATYDNLAEYQNGTDPRVADTEEDGMTDGWEVFFFLDPLSPWDGGLDFDLDGLDNLHEFQWRLVPVCTTLARNCWDHERDALDESKGGDLWRDGDEVLYWNDTSNDDANYTIPHGDADAVHGAVQQEAGGANATTDEALGLVEQRYGNASWHVPASHLLFDPDAQTDSDHDGRRDVADPDSDDDGLLDGMEVFFLGTYPELADSDCNEAPCTSSFDVTNRFDPRQGAPGTGDGINDGDENDAWLAISEFAAWVDYDGDGITNNLLDPDSDGDGLLDGDEFLTYGSNPGLVDSDRDGLSDPDEVFTYGTQPGNWDTDGDGLPDGYEVAYGFNPLDPTDGGMDPDDDAYNPHGDVTPERPWTTRDEYEHARPASWNESLDGTWTGGTDPLVADTDGDLVLDGVEVAQGSDPLDPDSYSPGDVDANQGPGDAALMEAAKADPTNEDLPEELMDPTNLQYLREGRTDAAARANETVEVADELIAAAIAGNVTQALNVVYNRTPVGPPLRNATETMALTQEALVSLVRCAPEDARPALAAAVSSPDWVDEAQTALVPGVSVGTDDPVGDITALARDPPSLVDAATGAVGFTQQKATTLSQSVPERSEPPSPEEVNGTLQDPEPFVMDRANQTDAVAGCMMETLLPFLDALLDRTLQEVPVAQDLVANLQEETIPGVVDTLDSVVPLDVQGTTQALLERPVGTVAEATLDLAEYATDPASITDAVTQADAVVDAVVAPFIKPTTKHPQLLHDTLFNAGNGLEAHWPTVLEANEELKQASGGEADAIATIDSLALNLYTNRDGAENVTAVPVGKRTCITLDDSTLTRDNGGCDLYATYLPTVANVDTEVPSRGRTVTPSLRIERAVASASYDMEAVAYLQVPNEPYLMVIGYNATDGLPVAWEGTITEADVRGSMDRSFAFTSTYEDTRNSMPLHVAAGVFRIDTGLEGKPAVPGNETVVHMVSDTVPDRVHVAMQRLPSDASRVETGFLLDASGSADWSLLYRDDVDAWQSRLALDLVDLPAGKTRIQHDPTATGLAWTWSSPGVVDSADVGYQERTAGQVTRAFQLNGTDVPASLELKSDRSAHRHDYTASSTPNTLDVLAGEGTDSCLSLSGVADLHLLFDHSDGMCVAGTLDGYTSLTADSKATQARASGTRGTATSQATVVGVRDGNTVRLELADSPASWLGDFSIIENATQDLQWTASAASPELVFEALLDQGSRQQLLSAHATDVPTQLTLSLDTLTGEGNLTANDYVGSADLAFSTTGNAPSAASGGDFLRLRELAVDPVVRDLESGWHVEGARDLQARILPGGAFEVTGDYTAPRPISVMYRDEDHVVELSADLVTGAFQWLLEENGPAGTLSLSQDASTVGNVELVASMPGGLVHFLVTDAPSQYELSADLGAQSIAFDASSYAGSVDARYAPDGSHPTLPASSAFVVVQDDPTGAGRGFHLHADDVKRLAATHTGDALTLDCDLDAPSPLDVRFDDGGDAYHWTVSEAPGHADVSQSAGRLSWNASGVTDFTLQASLGTGPRYLQANASQAPATLDASWTGATVDAFTATVTHSATTLPAFTLQEYQGTTGAPDGEAAGTYLDLADAPAMTSVRFVPADGVANATARTADGAPALVGRIDAAFGDRVQSLVTAHSSFDGDTLFLDDQGTAATAALLATDLRDLDVRLFLDAGNTGDLPVHAARTTPGGLYVKAHSQRHASTATLVATDAAPVFDLRLRPGTDARDGFHVAGGSGAGGGGVALRMERDNGRDLGFSTVTTPAVFEAGWAFGDVLRITASEPLTVTVQSAQDLDAAPWTADSDFIAVEQAADTRFGAHLTGITFLELDSLARTLTADGDQQVAPVVVDSSDPVGAFRLVASDTPRGLDLAWDPVARTISYTASDAVASLRFMTLGGSDSVPRLHASLSGIPAGATTVAQDVSGRSFHFEAPAPIGRFRLATDNGGTGPLQGITEEGLFFTEGDGDLLRANLAGVMRLEADLSMDAWLERTGVASPERTLFRFQLPEQRLTASLDGMNAGVTRLDWPLVGGPLAASASGVAGRSVELASVTDNDHFQAALAGAPTSWSLTAAATGELAYAASDAAATASASAAWQGAAFRFTAQDLPTGLTVVPGQGLRTGAVTASGGDAGRLTLSLASTGTGAVPVPATGGRDLLSVDATDSGGVLALDLAGLRSVAWSLPGSADEASGAPLSLHITRSTPATRSALVQLVHADHQSRATFPDGLPAVLDVELVREPQAWSADVLLPGKDMTLQHQDVNAGSFTLTTQDAAQGQSVQVDPRAQQAFQYTASGASGAVGVVSNWGQGYVRSDLQGGVPAKFVVGANGLLPGEGSVSTVGTGSVGRADVLLVPGGGSTVNRVTSQGDHAAVELMAKTPYLSLNIHDLEAFTWTLPDATTQRPLTASLERSTSHTGESIIVLSGPREDVTAQITDSAAISKVELEPGNRIGSTKPVRVLYDCLQGSTGRFAFTHTDAETGELLNSYLDACHGSTQIEGTGAEPASIAVDSTDTQGRAYFETMDLGTALVLDVRDVTPRFRALMDRQDCGITTPFAGEVSTMGAGITGPARILIGDNGRVPSIQGEGLDARCLQQGDARMAFALPAVKLSNWELGGGACSSWLDVPGDLKHVVVETANNLLDIILAILDSDPTLGPGAGVQVLDSGVHHSATSRFKVLDEHIECPDKMRFIEPVEWLQVQAGDAAPDLVIDLNPKPRPSDGKLFETIEIQSPSGALTDSLWVQSKTETVTQEQSFEAQLRYLSPFNNLDVWVGDRSMFQTAEGLHTDQVMGLLNGGLNYHTHFTDLQLFDGNVQHLECGSRDEINVEYERIPGRPEHDVSFWMDLGASCDKQRFDVEPFPVTLEYQIDWEDLCDNSIIVPTMGGRIDALRWWRSAHRFCPFADVPVNLEPAAGAAWYIEALDVPAGPLDVGIKLGKAGQIKAISQGGTIGHLGFGVSAGRGSDVYAQTGFDNVKLRMEWDLDGDTRREGNPRYVFIDTDNHFMDGTQRIRMGPIGFGHSLHEVRFEDFQVGMKWKTKSFIEYPVFYRNGDIDYAVGYTAELMVNDRWYSFPARIY